MERQIRPVLFSIILFALAFHILGAIAPPETVTKWFLTDDAHFYFVVARNIGAGNGITFDGIGLSSGFHPLWMLVILPVFAIAKADPILPLRILIVVMGLFHAGTVYFVYRILSRIISAEIALVGAVIWAFSPGIHAISARNGLESPLSAFMLAALLFAVLRSADQDTLPAKDILIIGLLGGLTFLARLDNIFTVSMLGLWLVFRKTPLRYWLLIDILSAYLTTSASYMLRLGLGNTFYQYSNGIFIFFACTAAVRILSYYFFGLYHQAILVTSAWLMRAAAANLIAPIAIAGLTVALTSANILNGFPRMALLYEAGLGALLFLLTRSIVHFLFKTIEWNKDQPMNTLKASWKDWMRDAALYFGVVAVILGAYIAWSQFTYGTSTPVSGQIKEWWGTLPDTVYGDPSDNAVSFYGLDPQFDKGPWAFAFSTLFAPLQLRTQTTILIYLGVLALSGLGLLKLNQSLLAKYMTAAGLLPLLAGSLLQFWTYSTRAYVGFRQWYWTGELLFTTLCTALLLEVFSSMVRDPIYRKAMQMLMAIGFALVLAFNFGTTNRNLIRQNVEIGEESWYLGNVRALEEHTTPGDVIGMTGGGDVAYFVTDRTIINLDGLINSTEYFTLLKQFHAAEYAQKIGMDYVFSHPYMITQSDPYNRNFAAYLTHIIDLGEFSLFKFTYP